MNRGSDLLLTALAPAIWGSTYVVTTLMLPQDYPLTVAMLRALPAGLLLLLAVRQLPRGIWWLRAFILGALNFSVFWALLFVAAYRLPGGVAATLGAIQPLVVILLARSLLGTPVRGLSVLAALGGLGGVALLVLTPKAALDPAGIAAGLTSAASMALGTVLSRRWQPPVSALTFTSWQLTAGGILLVPLALAAEPALPPLTVLNVTGIAYLGLIGAALTYVLWFRGVARLEPAVVSSLGFLSPITAVLLGWGLLGQHLSAAQIAGMAIVVASVWLSQRVQRPASPAPAARAKSPA
ncbi:EamA family transporter [Achromobacter insolitus]|uniref:EamA family transporter n=1 Tax=Achromobacter insolitus TaxID=217204 RepID=UPI0007C7057F|nr:EamA family transporter [Achromobacter insolitus]MCP1401181.1 putative blue pigment (indigoidine) exporter [Achromobacter insolitus]OAE62363.1 ABC transporter permease [Achromobacter insolitus]OCZ62724.1 ABC transporter permease [Achromobacter insolitus]WKK18486.1 EamA family transporter [Achromobacter insolitus]